MNYRDAQQQGKLGTRSRRRSRKQAIHPATDDRIAALHRTAQ